MKLLKRVLSLCLVLCCILSCVNVYAASNLKVEKNHYKWDLGWTAMNELADVINTQVGLDLDTCLVYATSLATYMEKHGYLTEKAVLDVCELTFGPSKSYYADEGIYAVQKVFLGGERYSRKNGGYSIDIFWDYANSVNIKINGEIMSDSNGVPYINNVNRTMAPLRSFAEKSGCKVEWIQKTQEIKITPKNSNTIKNIVFQIGKKSYSITDNKGKKTLKSMDTAPVINGSRTYIPLRFAAEALGYSVHYESQSNTAFCRGGR